LLPLDAGLAQLPRLVVDATAKDRLCHGQSAAVQASAGGTVALFDTTGRLIGVGTVDRVQGFVAPTKILESRAGRED
jgi:tRNA U55 pseudouridine synthase TruB